MTCEEIKIKFGYDFVDFFWQGVATASKDGKWFHINEAGTPLYSARFYLVELMQNEFAWVKIEERIWRIINMSGQIMEEGFKPPAPTVD